MISNLICIFRKPFALSRVWNLIFIVLGIDLNLQQIPKDAIIWIAGLYSTEEDTEGCEQSWEQVGKWEEQFFRFVDVASLLDELVSAGCP